MCFYIDQLISLSKQPYDAGSHYTHSTAEHPEILRAGVAYNISALYPDMCSLTDKLINPFS